MENGDNVKTIEEKSDANSQEVRVPETPEKSANETPKNNETKKEEEKPEAPEVTPELLEKIQKQVEVFNKLRFTLGCYFN